jgi:predicted TIM-barrel fold metal-dependent hydrolase
MSDDAALVDLIPHIVPSEAARQLMLVDNPAQFFGF